MLKNLITLLLLLFAIVSSNESQTIDHECTRELLSNPSMESFYPKFCINQTHYLHVRNDTKEVIDAIILEKYKYQQGLGVAILHHSEVEHYPTLAGPWFNFDTWVIGTQFGHVASKLMQYYNLQILHESCSQNSSNQVKLIMTHFTAHLARTLDVNSTPNIHLIVSLVFGGNDTFHNMIEEKKIVFAEHLEHRNKQFVLLSQPTCFDGVFHFKSYETTFLSRYVADRWRQRVMEFHGPLLKYSLSECPRVVKVLSLIRNEGTCLRQIKNFHIVEEVLAEMGLTYENVTINSNTTAQAIVETFSGFSLMITSHSSALKNLIFSRKGAAVLELRPGEHEFRNPFGDGLEHSDVFFKLSKGHRYSNSTGTHSMTYRDDFYVIKDVVVRDLKAVLHQQHTLCGYIPKHL